jgi:hypothetical protein
MLSNQDWAAETFSAGCFASVWPPRLATQTQTHLFALVRPSTKNQSGHCDSTSAIGGRHALADPVFVGPHRLTETTAASAASAAPAAESAAALVQGAGPGCARGALFFAATELGGAWPGYFEGSRINLRADSQPTTANPKPNFDLNPIYENPPCDSLLALTHMPPT